MVNNEPDGQPVVQPSVLPEATSSSSVDDSVAMGTSLRCSLPLSHDVQTIIATYPKTEAGGGRRRARKLACLYCERTFVADTLRTKHVERCHSTKQARRSSSRFQQPAAPLQCMFCSGFPPPQASADLAGLFRHLAGDHADRYLACVECEERFVLPSQLHEHLEDEHHARPPKKAEEEEARSKRGGLKNARMGIKRSARLLNKELMPQPAKIAQRQRKVSGRKPDPDGGDRETAGREHPYGPYDAFYRVKKITDHSIDNLRITSLTFNDVFDQAFYARIRCNIADNLRNHIDGKLFGSEESESRISNFEKQQQAEMCASADSAHFGCEISLNAATPVAALLAAHLGDDPETQIEYAAKASRKKARADEVRYKYVTRRKYQASIREIKENRDLSKLDMWTQFAVRNRQQAIANGAKSEKERQEYRKSDEYRMKRQHEELNKILDRRGPFEDLKQEATQQAQLDGNVGREAQMVASVLLEHVLGSVFEASLKEGAPAKTELTDAEMPEYLHLQKVSLGGDAPVDWSDKITLICSSEETDNFEAPHASPRDKHALVELTGECTRARLYICAACGIKVGNMRELLDHKSLDHPNVWCQHYEFVGKQGAYYRNLSIPGLGKVEHIERSPLCKSWVRSGARVCSKCSKQCNALGELHRHVLECGEDWSWMLMRKKCRYRPFGTRRKRRGLFKRQIPHAKEKSNGGEEAKEEKKKAAKPNGPRVKPSDAETIQRMLANLPPKRATRKIMSLKDGFPRQMRKLDAKGSAEMRKAKTKELKKNESKRKVLVTNKCNPVGNIRKSVRNLNKVISSALIDNNLRIRRKLKLTQARAGQAREKAMFDPLVSLGDLTDEERAVEVKKKISLLKKVQRLRKSVIKKRTDIKSESDEETGGRSATTVPLEAVADPGQTNLYKKIGSRLICGLSLRKKGKEVPQTEKLPDHTPEGSTGNAESEKREPRFGSIKKAVKKLRTTNRKMSEKQRVVKEIAEVARDIKSDVSSDHFLEESFLEKPIRNLSEPDAHAVCDSSRPSLVGDRSPLTSESQPPPEPISLASHLKPSSTEMIESHQSSTPFTVPASTVKAKNKICKRAKGLNDCIAMLTSKLTCKNITISKHVVDEHTKPDLVLPHDVRELTPNDTSTEEQNVVIPEDPVSETVLESAKEPASPSVNAIAPLELSADFSLNLSMTTSLITSLDTPVIELDKENIELEHKSIPKFDKVMEQVMKELKEGHHVDGNKVLMQADDQLFNGIAKKPGKLGVRCNVLKKHVDAAELLIQDQLNMVWVQEEPFVNGSFDRKLGSKRSVPQRKLKKCFNREKSVANDTKTNPKQEQPETVNKQEKSDCTRLETLAATTEESIVDQAMEINGDHKTNESGDKLSEVTSHCDSQENLQPKMIQEPAGTSDLGESHEEKKDRDSSLVLENEIQQLTLHVEPEKEVCVLEDKSLFIVREIAEENRVLNGTELNSDDSEDELPLAELVRKKLPFCGIGGSKTLCHDAETVADNLIIETQTENKESLKQSEELESTPETEIHKSLGKLEKCDIMEVDNITTPQNSNGELLIEEAKVVLQLSQTKKTMRKRKSGNQLLKTHFGIEPQLPESHCNDILPVVAENVPTAMTALKRTRNNKRKAPAVAGPSDFPSEPNVCETPKEPLKSAISIYDFAENDDDIGTSRLLIKPKETDKELKATRKAISKVIKTSLEPAASTPMKEIQNESFIQTPDLNDSGIVKKLSKLKMRGQRSKARSKTKKSHPAQNGTTETPEIFCEICNRSFLRTDSLTKHRRTLTHIAKLSELEALEAAANKKKEEDALEHEPIAKPESPVACNISSGQKAEEEFVQLESKSLEESIPPKDASQEQVEILKGTVDPEKVLVPEKNPEDNGDFTNHEAYNIELVNIISDLKNIHVELTRYKSLGERKSFDSDSTVYTPVPQFASIHPASNLASKTASDEFLKNQLSMLENIIEENKVQFGYMEEDSIESNQDSMQSNKFSRCLSDMSIESETTKHIPQFTSQMISVAADENTFVKPADHEAFDEISEDFRKKTSFEELDKQRQRKTLNRDEELFLECCSLLKSSSEMSNNFRNATEDHNAVAGETLCVRPLGAMSDLPEEDFLSESCPNSPIQGSYDNSTSDSWHGKLHGDSRDDFRSSNAEKCNLRKEKSEDCAATGYLFNERPGSEESNSNSADFRKNIDAKFGGLIAEAMKNKSPSDKCSHTKNKMELQTSIKDFTIPFDCKSDSSDIFDLTSDSRKMLTKGAMKVFDSIKVSIPTEDLDMQQVLLCSPTSKRLELEECIKLNGKQMQFGNKLGLKVTKLRDQRRKPKPSENYLIEREKHYDVYDFEETQDNTDLYLSTKLQKNEATTLEVKHTCNLEDDSEGQSMNSFSTETESSTSLKAKPPPTQGDNLTKKKCVIMGRIFKNAFKSKTDGVKEASPQLDDALESYIIGGPVEEIATPPPDSPKANERSKLTEKEMDLLFDKLLQSDNPKTKEVANTATFDDGAEADDGKKAQLTPKLIKSSRRRSKKHGDMSDDEFNLSQLAKKRKSRRCHKKKDDGINLEQELKECMGVAGRKSQRKCTSGKQNVFIEYWSSDDSEFEAILKLSMQETPSTGGTMAPLDKATKPVNNGGIGEVKPSGVPIEAGLPFKALQSTNAKPKRRQNGCSRPKSRCKSKSPKYSSTAKTEDTLVANRRKRAGGETLYYWSSSSEDDTQNLIEIKSLRDEMDDEEDRPQHGWIVGDSPKKLVTLLAHAKGKKSCNF